MSGVPTLNSFSVPASLVSSAKADSNSPAFVFPALKCWANICRRSATAPVSPGVARAGLALRLLPVSPGVAQAGLAPRLGPTAAQVCGPRRACRSTYQQPMAAIWSRSLGRSLVSFPRRTSRLGGEFALIAHRLAVVAAVAGAEALAGFQVDGNALAVTPEMSHYEIMAAGAQQRLRVGRDAVFQQD